MTRVSITGRQRQVLELLFAGIQATGVQPSLHELAEKLGVKHPNGIRCILRSLAKKGYVERASVRSSRSLWLLKDPEGRPISGFLPRYTEGEEN